MAENIGDQTRGQGDYRSINGSSSGDGPTMGGVSGSGPMGGSGGGGTPSGGASGSGGIQSSPDGLPSDTGGSGASSSMADRAESPSRGGASGSGGMAGAGGGGSPQGGASGSGEDGAIAIDEDPLDHEGPGAGAEDARPSDGPKGDDASAKSDARDDLD